MRNPEELIRENAHPKDFIAVSWNLHKGRSPLGLQAWQAMQRWVQSTHADAYFLQEAMARRMPSPVLSANFGAPLGEPVDDIWHCQATEIASSLQLQIALGDDEAIVGFAQGLQAFFRGFAQRWRIDEQTTRFRVAAPHAAT